ncbi:hypothetical protein BDR26DRAFT_159827 [Obelidium mucronatum]|nr:hypothetical protein BDR26DRAFT_159827 [Obelidium mucronatum]
MFIKPIDTSLFGGGEWTDKAGNHHFALQQKKAAAGLGFFFGAAAAPAAAAASKEFRILLRCAKKSFVVAVGASFDEIHEDWNWVEHNLLAKLLEWEAASGKRVLNTDGTHQIVDLDRILLKQFEEITEEVADPRENGAQVKAAELHAALSSIFPELQTETILNSYACSYWPSETSSVRGTLSITRNYTAFHSTESTDVVCIAFKEVFSVDLAGAKGVLAPDGITISVGDKGEKTFYFSLYFSRKDIFRILSALCDSAMNRLVKGAETSLIATSDMFAKSNANGDLASGGGGGSGAGGNGNYSRSKNDDFEEGGEREELDEEDFSAMRASVVDLTSPISASAPIDFNDSNNPISPIIPPSPTLYKPATNTTLSLLHYSHTNPATCSTTDALEAQLKNLEFRTLFALPLSETITLTELQCTFFQKTANQTYTGVIYLSQSFFTFVGTGIAAKHAANNMSAPHQSASFSHFPHLRIASIHYVCNSFSINRSDSQTNYITMANRKALRKL